MNFALAICHYRNAFSIYLRSYALTDKRLRMSLEKYFLLFSHVVHIHVFKKKFPLSSGIYIFSIKRNYRKQADRLGVAQDRDNILVLFFLNLYDFVSLT